MAAMAAMFVACSDDNEGAGANGKAVPAPIPSEETPAYKLAVLDEAVPLGATTDMGIRPYSVALDALGMRCTESTAEQIADYTVAAQRQIGERRGIEPSLLEIMQTAAGPGFDVSTDCAPVFTAVIFDFAP